MTRSAYFLLGMSCLALLGQAAEARRFRVFGVPGFSAGESIDLVHDLPDEEPFVTDGSFVDVGWLNGRSSNGYVLYHGDRYRTLDDADLAVLKTGLGFDPTAKHRAQYAIDHADELAEQKAERAAKDDRIAKGLLIERRADESSADFAVRRAAFVREQRASPTPAADAPQAEAASSSGGAGSLGFGSILVVLVVLGFAVRKLLGRRSALAEAAGSGSARVGHADQLSFEERIAKRLGEMQKGEPHSPAAERFPNATPLQPAAPAPRGFGRKVS